MMEKLEKNSLLSLSPVERLELLKLLTEQLMTFFAFREAEDLKLDRLKQMKSELRQLRMTEQALERESRNAVYRLEHEEELREAAKERQKEQTENLKKGKRFTVKASMQTHGQESTQEKILGGGAQKF